MGKRGRTLIVHAYVRMSPFKAYSSSAEPRPQPSSSSSSSRLPVSVRGGVTLRSPRSRAASATPPSQRSPIGSMTANRASTGEISNSRDSCRLNLH